MYYKLESCDTVMVHILNNEKKHTIIDIKNNQIIEQLKKVN